MDALTELLAKLVSIPSMNTMGRPLTGPEYGEAALSAFLEDWLGGLDVEVRRQPVAPGRDNILATYRSPSSARHVLLEVHQDTVPADAMVIDPFNPKVEGNRLYGRGACDNKGPMAAMMMAFRRLAHERPTGAASVTLALTVDEEFTFLGVQELVKSKLDVACAIVAEPTCLDIVTTHKGTVRWKIRSKGRACHSSSPHLGVNAIYRMAPVILALQRYAGELSQRPGDPVLGARTLSVGRIEGGVSVNVVPDHCTIEIDRRVIPGENPMAAYQDVVAYLENDPETQGMAESPGPWMSLPSLYHPNNESLADWLSETVRAVRGTCKSMGVPFGTDASSLTNAGIPTVVFGPGSIAQAHTDNEWVPLDEVGLAGEIYYRFCVEAGKGRCPWEMS